MASHLRYEIEKILAKVQFFLSIYDDSNIQNGTDKLDVLNEIADYVEGVPDMTLPIEEIFKCNEERTLDGSIQRSEHRACGFFLDSLRKIEP
ncbi:unnamed protein product [Phytomonas sp. EM1]|nr:unnamed protein product [Phytomonas sp. EM1]|eukprot:CCW64372.1 unnamed protein product [Phytomonas sp. isolate EM1]